MTAINKTKKKTRDENSHLNWMGGTSFDIKDPINKLRVAASSCFFGEPMYYQGERASRNIGGHSGYRITLDKNQIKHLRETLDAIDPQEWRGMNASQLMESAIDDALAHDAERTLELAAELRNVHFIRTTPQVILVRAAMHKNVKGTGLVRKYAKDIIKRADEMSVGLAYFLSQNGGSKSKLPNALKKAWKDAFGRFDDYQLSKYRMESREVKTVDVANLCHGINRSLEDKPYHDQKLNREHENTPVSKLLRNELTVGERTWEGLISANGSTKETWERVIDEIFVPVDSRSGSFTRVNNYMALLRNVCNMVKAGISKDHMKVVIDALKNPNAVLHSKQLPFRFYSAYRQIEKETDNPRVLDAIEDALRISLGNVKPFPGRVMSLCDNSGSAWGTMTSSAGTMQIARIANLTGVITGMVSDEGYVGIFGDRLETLPIRKSSSIFDTLKKIDGLPNIGRGTENGIWLFFDKAIKEKEHWDSIFVYSDMQAGHGGLYGTNPSDYGDYQWESSRYRNHIDVAKLVSRYRTEVNPNVMVYLVQVAGYQDTLVPEYYNRTFVLGGWSDAILRFANQMETEFNG